MSRAWPAVALAVVLAVLMAGAAFAQDPTETPTPAPTLTPTPPWELLVVLPVSGQAMLIERRWSYGEEAIFFAVVGLIGLVGVLWIYDVVRGEAGRREDGRHV